MNEMKLYPIGKIENYEETIRIILDKKYREGLKGLDGYSHVLILWWADGCDNEKDRSTLTEQKPYKNGPDELGVFALRSPERPNPIEVSNADIAYVDVENGVVGLYYVDAFDGTQVLDLKPYTPSIDRIENPKTPDWCGHWPKSYEESGDFDWASEFNFYEANEQTMTNEQMTENMIAWAKDKIGIAEYAGWCLDFIEDALEQSNDIEIFGGDSAKESCEMYQDALRTDIPERGAFVFYDCLCPSKDGPVNWGHCGISLGDGQIIHAWNMVRIDDYTEIEHLTALTGDHPKYLGWVPLSRVLAQKPD